MRMTALIPILILAGCSEVAWNTTVANEPASRLAMARAVVPGQTTERDLILRWGAPTQKVREGAQTSFIYRDMRNPPDYYFPQFGTSERYVIVTFQYGIATGVTTSDDVPCRATFQPRPPNYGFDNPTTVHVAGDCPLSGLWPDTVTDAVAGPTPDGETARPGVPEDGYDPEGKAGK